MPWSALASTGEGLMRSPGPEGPQGELQVSLSSLSLLSFSLLGQLQALNISSLLGNSNNGHSLLSWKE